MMIVFPFSNKELHKKLGEKMEQHEKEFLLDEQNCVAHQMHRLSQIMRRHADADFNKEMLKHAGEMYRASKLLLAWREELRLKEVDE